MALDRDDAIPDQLRLTLAGFDTEDLEDVTRLVALHREFPGWAVWVPEKGRPWAAARPEQTRSPQSSQAKPTPAPGQPMLWVHAPTAAGLAEKMQAEDAHLPPHPSGRQSHRRLPGPWDV